MNKDEIISEIYKDYANFGSQKETLREAKKKDKSITSEDVKLWYQKNIIPKTIKCYNRFVAPIPKFEYQIDLMIMNDLKDEGDRKFPYALVCIDIFDRYGAAVPIKSKQPDDILDAIITVMKKMGGKPEYIFSDNEGSFNSKLVQNYFRMEDIKHLTSLNRVPFVDRFVRTLKNMIYKRLEHEEKMNDGKHENWWWALPKVLLVYNNYKIHSTIEMRPVDARKPDTSRL